MKAEDDRECLRRTWGHACADSISVLAASIMSAGEVA